MRTRAAAARLALAVAMALALARPARAQRGIDAETFRPSFDSYGIFTVDRAETGRQWDVGFRVFSDYAHAPLTLEMKDAAGVAADRTVMSWQLAVHLGLHLSLTDWLEIGFIAPLSTQRYGAAFGTNADPLNPTGFFAADPRTNVGIPDGGPLDARVGLKIRTPRLGPVGGALVLTATLPFGNEAAFAGDAGFTFRPTAVIDVTFLKGFTAAINVGYVLRQKTVVLDPYDVVANRTRPADMRQKPATLLEVGDELTASLGLAYRIGSYVGLAAEAYGLVPLGVEVAPTDRLPAQRDVVLGVLGGINVFPGRSIQLSLGGGAGLPLGTLGGHRREQFRAFFGLTWVPAEGGRFGGLGGGDADGDGVPDNTDKCPSRPEDKDGFDDADGCPDPDNDQDGVPDDKDRCTAEPEDKDGYQDDDGCPEPDNDFDGVPDTTDKCPNESEDKDGYQDEDGCPELDNDGDGIPDTADKCPGEPETQNGIDDDDGCPDRVGGDKGGQR